MPPRSIVNTISRGAVALVIDHHQVNHALNTVSVHVLEIDGEKNTIRGFDIDGVTVEELGSTGEIAAAITGERLVKFVASVSGMTVKLDEAPPAPAKEEAKTEGADTGAP